MKDKKFQALMPIITEKSMIIGFVPDDWMINHSLYQYKPCCQDPRNWTGTGETVELSTEPYDPVRARGFVSHRRCVCSKCGARVNGEEYLKGEA